MNSTQGSDVIGELLAKLSGYARALGEVIDERDAARAELAALEAERNMAPEERDEMIRKAMAALRSTGITTALRERAEVVLRAIGAIQ